MARKPVSLIVEDVSAFARAMAAGDCPEGHQAWLNRIARAAGYRNFQHLSALRREADPPADRRKVARARQWFDETGRFERWPARRAMRELCLWAVWAGLPRGELGDERAISRRIDAMTAMRDAAQIRRGLIEMALLRRNLDGTGYARLERRPPPEARALIAEIGVKSAT